MTRLDALERCLDELGRVAVAVSGGVDSTTLAVVAHRRLRGAAEMFHALSPAVPAEATARVRRYAAREGWAVRILDAGEFGDADYLGNPANRCYFCKRNLYGTIAPLTGAVLVSGTNTDDLDEYRPGLDAARERAVRHPYLEVGIDKAGVRAIARRLDLVDLAELPSAPCLSSRIETGIRIEPAVLAVVERIEHELRATLAPETVRCRLRAGGVVVELDEATLERLAPEDRQRLRERVAGLWRARGFAYPVRLEPYRKGSAFVTEQT